MADLIQMTDQILIADQIQMADISSGILKDFLKKVSFKKKHRGQNDTQK